MTKNWIKPLFIVAGIYDALLGLIFFFAYEGVFAYFEVAPPNHPAYVKFPALLLTVFGAMFLHIATDPVRLRALIPYGIALKVTYAGMAFWYQLTMGIPSMWLPWAWFDLVFLVAFLIAFSILPSGREPA